MTAMEDQCNAGGSCSSGSPLDVALNLGTSAVWQRLSGPLPVENVRDLAELGAIEESGIGAVRLSGTRRSAGITYWHRSKWRSSEMPVGAALVVE